MNLLIIQARMGSTRFPGKVLAKIEDIPILKILFDRVCESKYADQIVVLQLKIMKILRRIIL